MVNSFNYITVSTNIIGGLCYYVWKNNRLKIITPLLLYLFISNGPVHAQNCNNFHVNNCEGIGSPFQYSTQSRSTAFEKGQTSIFHINVFKNFEYSINISFTENMKDIFFRLRDDNTTQDILYDSYGENNGILETRFISNKTGKLIIEVVVPAGNTDQIEEDYNKRIGCVGVLVEFLQPLKPGIK